MNAQIAARHAAAPQTPPLPQAKPESLGLSSVRLQRMSDAFKRDIDKGTIPGVTVMVARRGSAFRAVFVVRSIVRQPAQSPLTY